VCAQLRPGDAVLAVDSRGANEWPQVVRGVCDVPSASVRITDARITDPGNGPAVVRRVAGRILAAGRRPVLLAATPEGAQLLDDLGLAPAQAVDIHTTEDQRYLTRVPDGVAPLAIQVWLAQFPASVSG
jgi:hypothetical protein